jgi:hypothetical protein
MDEKMLKEAQVWLFRAQMTATHNGPENEAMDKLVSEVGKLISKVQADKGSEINGQVGLL